MPDPRPADTTAPVARELVIVTEDPLYGELLRYGFSAQNIHCTITASGAAAQDVIAQQKPDGVILNIFMALTDAFKLLHWLQNSGLEIPVLALTSSEDRALTVEVVVAGAKDILVKPLTFATILESVNALLPQPIAAEESALNKEPTP